MNRRQFFKNSILGALGVAVLGTLETTKAWAADLIKMNKDGSAAHTPAKGMGYVSDVEKALASKSIQKASGLDATKIKTKDQNCAGCMFYSAGKDAKQGPCQVIPGKLVHGAGSCNTWVKRA